MQQELLPLFPLQVVLFPRTPVALHIFEERYKEMIGESIGQNTEFGIVLAGEKGIVNAGCTAIVDKVTQQYDDGRMDIIATGRRRFEIQELDTGRAFLRSSIEFYDDNDGTDVDANLRTQVLELYQQIIKLSANSSLLDPELTDNQLSFQLAQVISDLMQRQLLLISRSEAERMRRLAEYFPTLIGERRAAVQSQKAARTNGHGKRPAGL